MQERDYRLLKGLALEFVKTNDTSIFTAIVKMEDRLVLYSIHKAIGKRNSLMRVPLQDLYQSALVGLYLALLKVKEDEPGSKIVTKIIRYIINEVLKDNKEPREKPFTFSNRDKLIDDTLVYKNLEMEFIRERFWKLINDKVISFEEFEMIVMRFVDGMSYEEIASQFIGKSRKVISRKIKKILKKMKDEFAKRGWEEF